MILPLGSRDALDRRQVERPSDPDGLVLEAWAQGFMIGALVIMVAITISNMRRHVLLHKLIFIELILAMGHGTFIFLHQPIYGWYLSVTAIGLNISWSLHNFIAWIKNKPFFSRRVKLIYLWTLIIVQPYWILEIYANFTYFNNINTLFVRTRPWEPLCRDPWWLYTTVSLFYTIKKEYSFTYVELVKISPRFGIMLASMCLSVIFIVVDTCNVVGVFDSASLPKGLNPWWKFSFIFKCLCDTVILDDFKTALDSIRQHWMESNRSGLFNIPPAGETNLRRPWGSGSPRIRDDSNNGNFAFPFSSSPGVPQGQKDSHSRGLTTKHDAHKEHREYIPLRFQRSPTSKMETTPKEYEEIDFEEMLRSGARVDSHSTIPSVEIAHKR